MSKQPSKAPIKSKKSINKNPAEGTPLENFKHPVFTILRPGDYQTVFKTPHIKYKIRSKNNLKSNNSGNKVDPRANKLTSNVQSLPQSMNQITITSTGEDFTERLLDEALERFKLNPDYYIVQQLFTKKKPETCKRFRKVFQD